MSASHRLVIVAATAVLLLTGCAVPAPTPTIEPDPQPTETSVAQPAEPPSTLPLDCVDFGTLDQIQASFTEPLSVKVDEASAPRSSYRLEFLQAGGLDCIWGSENMTDSSWDDGVTLSVLGDAASDYQELIAQQPDDPAALVDTLGDASHTRCDAYDSGSQCWGTILVGHYFVSLNTGGFAGAPDADGVRSAYDAIAEHVVEVIRGAGEPPAAWVAPQGSFDGGTLCSDPAPVAAALGLASDQVTLASSDGAGGRSPPAWRRAGAPGRPSHPVMRPTCRPSSAVRGRWRACWPTPTCRSGGCSRIPRR